MLHLLGLVIILLIFKCLRKVVELSAFLLTRAVNAACGDTWAGAGKVKVCQQTG